jgi:hypothetical protein
MVNSRLNPGFSGWIGQSFLQLSLTAQGGRSVLSVLGESGLPFLQGIRRRKG